MNLELFNENPNKCTINQPLAEKLRPQSFDKIKGDQKLIFNLKTNYEHGLSIILFGPPGVGKTTIAKLLLKENKTREILEYRPAVDSLSFLKKIVEIKKQDSSILFVDEIHRMDKRQQDFLLPHIESGSLQLVGATTENPHVFCNNAVLSRVKTVELKKLSKEEMLQIYNQAVESLSEVDSVPKTLVDMLIHHSDGDARKLLGFIHQVNLIEDRFSMSEEEVLSSIVVSPSFDLNRHYDLLSAIIKSMRSGEVDEAIGWLGQFLLSGGDPLIIARRLVIFASEDVGNAAPFGLTLATSSFEAIKNVGMPEARINLAHIVTYLANAPKSRAAYDAINASIEYSKNIGSVMIPNKRLNRKNKIDCDEPRFPQFYFPSGKGHDFIK